MSENNHVKVKAAETVTEAELMAQNTLSKQLDQIQELLWANNCDATFVSTMYEVAYKMLAAGYTVENIIGTILQNVSVGIATGVWGKFSYAPENRGTARAIKTEVAMDNEGGVNIEENTGAYTPFHIGAPLSNLSPTPNPAPMDAQASESEIETPKAEAETETETETLDFWKILPEDVRHKLAKILTRKYFVKQGAQFVIKDGAGNQFFSAESFQDISEYIADYLSRNSVMSSEIVGCNGYWLHEVKDPYDSKHILLTACFGVNREQMLRDARLELCRKVIELLESYVRSEHERGESNEGDEEEWGVR